MESCRTRNDAANENLISLCEYRMRTTDAFPNTAQVLPAQSHAIATHGDCEISERAVPGLGLIFLGAVYALMAIDLSSRILG